MSKMIKRSFDEKLNFENMYNAYLRARKNKTHKREVLLFEDKLEESIVNIIYEIKDDTYRTGKYREFKVYEPKERLIKALPFKDRVVHQWLVYEFLIPNIVPKFIYDSYACIDNKGSHKAVKRLAKYIYEARVKYKAFYIIKMDVKKFFYSIDVNILFGILKKHIKDKKLINLCSKIIFGNGEKVGIPIGNYTSQYFANIYLNELDYYVKQTLRLKYYIRFMDDFVLIVEKKEDAKKIFLNIKEFLYNKLKLDINYKSRIYPSEMGVDFCGYRLFYTHKLIRNRCKKKMLSNIKKWNYLYKNNMLDIRFVRMSINSFKAHIKHANSYNLYSKYMDKIIFKDIV